MSEHESSNQQAGVDVAAVAAAATGGVVGVHSHGRRGTGVAVAPDRVVTTAHNTRGDTVRIVGADGWEASGRVAGRYPDIDLAVVTVEKGGLTPLSWGDPSTVQVGQQVVAIGAPDGIPRTTGGTVATTGARFRTATGSPVVGVIEHTAPLPSGSSGGPLLDGQGRVIGINTNRAGEGFYQAAPADQAFRDLVEQLAQGHVPTPRRLGVAITPSRRAQALRAAVGLPSRQGALVSGVEEDSPASAAGITRGDLIVGIDGQEVAGPDDLLVALRGEGDTAELSVARGEGEPRQVEVRFE